MQVTDEMVTAAMKKAIEENLLPHYLGNREQFGGVWDVMKLVIEAAFNASKE